MTESGLGRAAVRKTLITLPCEVCKAQPGEPCDSFGHMDEWPAPRLEAHERLCLFFYLLTRDHLPAGAVFSMIEECKKLTARPDYSNGHLEGLARSFVFLLITDPKG